MFSKKQKDLKRVVFALMVIFALWVLNLAEFRIAHAEEYPTKPITLIVPFAPGAGADITGRLVAGYLSKKWGQSISVVNVPGGGAVPGVHQALTSKPDGYTLFTDVHVTGAMMPAIYANLPFDWTKRTPIALVNYGASIYVVNSKSPYKTLGDLGKAVKENPNKFSWGGTGSAGVATFALGQFFDTIGVKVSDTNMVAFAGAAPALAAVAGGHIDISVGTPESAVALVSAGKIRALAVVSDKNKRLPELPETPTAAEAGYPSLDVITWQGISGPAGLPQSVVDKWAIGLQKAAQDQEFLSLAEKVKLNIAYLGPDDFKAFMLKEYKKYYDLARKLKIVIQSQ